jgi:hypothetical protein
MKKYILLLFCFTNALINAQGTWSRKADIGTQMEGAVSFSIGTKCYQLTGRNNSFILKEFWEWDQSTNAWIRKADFPGTARYFATGFSIGTKGYIGLGFDGIQSLQDFWEWDQATDTWTRKADFAGVARHHTTGFSIGSKGYIGTGWSDAGAELKDFWEWDQGTDQWMQKADFGGTGRQGAIGFSIGTKGYIGTGEDQFSSSATFPSTKDFWEWDQATNTWSRKADFAGTGRYHALGFSIGSKGYVGLGKDFNGGPDFYHDFWEWDQGADLWTLKVSPGGASRWLASGFAIGSKGYIGFGGDTVGQMKKDFWEFDPAAVTSVSETEAAAGVSISPNPNAGIFRITVPEPANETKLEIYNVLGEKVYTSVLTAHTTEIEWKGKKGIYFNRVIAGNKLASCSRMVIE